MSLKKTYPTTEIDPPKIKPHGLGYKFSQKKNKQPPAQPAPKIKHIKERQKAKEADEEIKEYKREGDHRGK